MQQNTPKYSNGIQVIVTLITGKFRAGFRKTGAREPGRPPTEGFTKPFQFYFSLMIDAYETTT